MTTTVRSRVDVLETLVSGLTAPELGFIDGVTAGTAAASKALVLNSGSAITTGITALTATTLNSTTENTVNLDAGASGTAGSVDVFPTTASKGKIAITATDSVGNTTTTITNASQAAARAYTIPDAGGDAKFVLGGSGTLSLSGTGGTSTGTMTTLAAQVTSAALTTAGQATHVATITYTGIAATDMVFATLAGGTNTTQSLVLKAACTTNTITVSITNATAATAVNGTIIFNLLVVKA